MDRWRIVIEKLAEAEMAELRPFDGRRVLDEIDAKLTVEPGVRARNRKPIAAIPGFHHVPPIWELRVGDHRVFYGFDEVERLVHIWAVRHKGNRTTEEIIR